MLLWTPVENAARKMKKIAQVIASDPALLLTDIFVQANLYKLRWYKGAVIQIRTLTAVHLENLIAKMFVPMECIQINFLKDYHSIFKE